MTKEVHRLEDLLVEEVSIVDRPANRRRFLTVKNEDGMQRGQEITTDEDGKLVTRTDAEKSEKLEVADPSEPQNPEASIDEIFKGLGEKIEKRLTIDPEMRRKIYRSLSENVNRLYSVMSATDAARSDEENADQSTLVPVLANELTEIGKELTAMGKKLGGVKKSDGETTDDVSKDEGPIVLSDEDRSALEVLVSEIEKRGAKMSKSRLRKFKEAVALLQSIYKELNDGEELKIAAKKDDVEKSEMNEIVELKKQFATMTEKATELAEVVRKQNKELRELREMPRVSNALSVEKSEDGENEDDDTLWPLDLNNEKTRDSVDKSISFME